MPQTLFHLTLLRDSSGPRVIGRSPGVPFETEETALKIAVQFGDRPPGLDFPESIFTVGDREMLFIVKAGALPGDGSPLVFRMFGIAAKDRLGLDALAWAESYPLEALKGELPNVEWQHLHPRRRTVDEVRTILKSGDSPLLLGSVQALLDGCKIAVSLAEATLSARQLDMATRRNPSDALAWQWLSNAHATLGDQDRRLQSIRMAAEVTPDSEDVLAALAEAEIYLRHPVESLVAVKKLIRLNPSAIEYRLMQASIHYLARDWSAAESSCREAMAINPMNAESHILRAMCLEALGKSNEAQKEAEIALALERNPEIQKQYRSWFRPKK